MAQTVKLKRSNTAGTIPTTSNLALGEVAINTKDGKFFLRKHVDGSTGDAIHAYAPQGINAYGTQELVVKVVTKTTAHPNHGSGSSSGYTVQGLEGPFLALIPGNTYKFDVSDSTNSGHPFRFYLDAAKASAYTTGVTTSGSAGNSGAYVQIAVTTSTPQVLYYQCSSHSLMGSAAYVASDAIAANAVGTSQIAQNSITSSEIPNNSIGATQISAAVLAAKQDNLGNNSITAAMISQNTVGISELNVSDGSANQVLTTNGSGTLSFANPSSGTVTETFKTISVSGQDDVVADGATDTLTLAGSGGMTITTTAGSDTVTFSSSTTPADDSVVTAKIADLNVTAGKLAANAVTSAKIATDAVGASEIAANSVGISELNVSDGSNGQVLTTNGSGTLSFTTAGGGSVSEAFKTLAVSGQDNVVADSATDTLTFAAGSNMTITTNASSDTITFASSGSGGSSSSFTKNTFTGDGSDTTFTLSTSMSNEDNLIVFIDGVYQADNVYSVSGTTLTFATAPVNGRLIEVFQIEGGIIGTAPVIATMTGDGSDTTLALGTTPNSENSTFVTIDGVMQHKSTYSVSGSTLTFSTAPPNGTAVEAITLVNQTTTSSQDSDGDTKIQLEESSDEDKIRFDTGGTERMIIDDAGKVGIGTASPQAPLHVSHATAPNFRLSRTGTGQIYQFGIDSSGRFLIQEAASEGGTRNSRFVIDDSGEVGIGSTAPDANLQIMNNDGSSYRFGYGGSSDVYLDADNVYIRTDNGGANTATFTTTGLGIGTTSPSRPLEVTGSATNFSGEIKVNNSSSASGAHGAIQFVTEGESSGLIIGKHSSGFSEPDLAFIYNELNSAMQFGTNNTERMRIDSSGKVGIATTSPSTALDILASTNSTNSAVYPVVTIQNTAANSDNSYAGLNVKGGNGQVNGFILADGRSSANVFSIRTETATPIQFNTNGSERMRIDSSGNLLIGKTVTTFGTAGIRFGSNGNSDFTRDDGNVINLNRTTSNGSLIGFYQDGTEEGNISVSGTNVYYNGFTGTHESSGIAADTAIGTVCSTIDELDTYVSGNKEGQTRTDHAKIKVSDTVGDSRVYGILSGFTETDNKPIVASVGIGSVLVTGSCTGGDLLESNGDGTAKVQDDDIIKSKTIGKVTIGNSDTNVKLVSCVLYCG